ncbi:MAG: (2S)-methylsuccinyl-CoA dehydrogenase [Acidimicrobiales bacterium]|nr:MAG: acyl-CoA dehydrogenase [Actinomycetota bacterium]MBV6507531.1 (2S)-methylsuccinyl-CoA dehydrogenase [Acidimicrobiales bacterium]RIK07473.1 MAG: acyl-CoA dehydrogenase [Acidobacteriota bacterium]
MDFELSTEQAMFREVVRRFVDEQIRPVAREWEHAGRYPAEIIEAMKDLGFFGITVPEAFGGMGADTVSMALLFEEISRGWMGIAGTIGSHSLSCRMIAEHGTTDQKDRWLPALATGQVRTGIALTEPDAGSDLQGIKTRAVRQGDHYLVHGTKTWITNARHAGMLPVLVKTDPEVVPAHRGMSVLLVEADTDGFSVGRDLGKLGYRGTESCEVFLDGCRVPAANLLGDEEGVGLKQVLSGLETGRVNVAARSVGIAQEALDQALAYAKGRQAFGRPIAEFQAIQLKLADMATEVQAARLLTYYAASRIDAGGRADREAGMAKLYASEAALRASLESMRIHGGYGYSTELDIERLYRDAPLMAIGEGTNDIQKLVIARSLLAED